MSNAAFFLSPSEPPSPTDRCAGQAARVLAMTARAWQLAPYPAPNLACHRPRAEAPVRRRAVPALAAPAAVPCCAW